MVLQSTDSAEKRLESSSCVQIACKKRARVTMAAGAEPDKAVRPGDRSGRPGFFAVAVAASDVA